MRLLLQVILCVSLVVWVGSRLPQSADVLAEKTGLGRSWVGAILLAGATSLPELASGISAVALFRVPDLAVGGVLGSGLFNLLILVIVDIFTGPEPLLRQVQVSHGLSAGLGCVMLGTAAADILLAERGVDLRSLKASTLLTLQSHPLRLALLLKMSHSASAPFWHPEYLCC